jgi:hypothetical protein
MSNRASSAPFAASASASASESRRFRRRQVDGRARRLGGKSKPASYTFATALSLAPSPSSVEPGISGVRRSCGQSFISAVGFVCLFSYPIRMILLIAVHRRPNCINVLIILCAASYYYIYCIYYQDACGRFRLPLLLSIWSVSLLYICRDSIIPFPVKEDLLTQPGSGAQEPTPRPRGRPQRPAALRWQPRPNPPQPALQHFKSQASCAPSIRLRSSSWSCCTSEAGEGLGEHWASTLTATLRPRLLVATLPLLLQELGGLAGTCRHLQETIAIAKPERHACANPSPPQK